MKDRFDGKDLCDEKINTKLNQEIESYQKIERQLKESEEKFRLLFEKSTDPIFLLDGDTYTDCNEAALKFMGCSRKEQLIGLRPSDTLPEKQPDGGVSSEKAKEFIGIALKKGSVRFEWVRRNFEGKEFCIDVSLTVIPVHGRKIMYVVWRDITERKRAEDALKKTEKKYRDIFENAVEGIFQFTSEERLVSANPAFAEMTGYNSPEELIQCVAEVTRQLFVNQEDYERWHELIEKNDVIDTFETEIYKKDRSTLWANINAHAVRDEHGKILFYEGTFTDISKRKQAEKKLEIKEKELEEKTKNLEEVNAALKVLLKERENDKKELEDRIVSNVKTLIVPYMEKLKKRRLDPKDKTYLEIIEANLNDIISPFLQQAGLKYVRLTPTELEIASLIKNGKGTKAISDLLHISEGTTKFHRNNIRKKLGLLKEKVNLRTYLLSLK
ncbi:MAG TPA: PAS domain S-box protein [Syntrophorhabdaceae bacterium]|nr:PAS domain S-box protein [Syntrophorhabdaceae bacterium]HPL42148.1 PAS domain S-box protein [Syntrophorhabdaceae bacterium]